MRVILGLDVGTKGIGVARAPAEPSVARLVGATPLRTVRRHGVRRDVEAILDLARSAGFEVQAVIVGLPLTEEGEEQRSSRLARQVAEALHEATNWPVHLQDETYSTLEAEERLRDQGVPGHLWPERIDAEAAAVILEDWLAASAG